MLRLRISEEAHEPQGLLVEGRDRAQERRLLVERLSRIGAEGRGDTQCRAGLVMPHEGR